MEGWCVRPSGLPALESQCHQKPPPIPPKQKSGGCQNWGVRLLEVYCRPNSVMIRLLEVYCRPNSVMIRLPEVYCRPNSVKVRLPEVYCRPNSVKVRLPEVYCRPNSVKVRLPEVYCRPNSVKVRLPEVYCRPNSVIAFPNLDVSVRMCVLVRPPQGWPEVICEPEKGEFYHRQYVQTKCVRYQNLSSWYQWTFML